jgi:hypothetical protein
VETQKAGRSEGHQNEPAGNAGAEQAPTPAPITPQPKTQQRSPSPCSRRVAARSYALLIACCRGRKDESAASFETLDEITGLAPGYCSKAFSPNSPSGRQANWDSLDCILEALFGPNFSITVSGEPKRKLGAPSSSEPQARTLRQAVHWRDRRFFQVLGAKGRQARDARHSDEQRREWARLGGVARWSKRDRANA